MAVPAMNCGPRGGAGSNRGHTGSVKAHIVRGTMLWNVRLCTTLPAHQGMPQSAIAAGRVSQEAQSTRSSCPPARALSS